jgi:hypothetical protein
MSENQKEQFAASDRKKTPTEEEYERLLQQQQEALKEIVRLMENEFFWLYVMDKDNYKGKKPINVDPFSVVRDLNVDLNKDRKDINEFQVVDETEMINVFKSGKIIITKKSPVNIYPKQLKEYVESALLSGINMRKIFPELRELKVKIAIRKPLEVTDNMNIAYKKAQEMLRTLSSDEIKRKFEEIETL